MVFNNWPIASTFSSAGHDFPSHSKSLSGRGGAGTYVWAEDGGVEPGRAYSAASGPPSTAGPQADDRLISLHTSPKDLGFSLSLSQQWCDQAGDPIGAANGGRGGRESWVPNGRARGREGIGTANVDAFMSAVFLRR